jgi:hypothetical protein
MDAKEMVKPINPSRRHSPYYKTLEDPFNYDGVKIPDDAMYPSSTFTVTYKLELRATEIGTTGQYFTGFAIDGLRPATSLVQITNFDGNNITWARFDAGGTIPGSLPQNDEIVQIYNRIRPVSAGIVIDPSMASLNDSGTIVGVNLPTHSQSVQQLNPPTALRYSLINDPQLATFSNLENHFNSLRTPVKEGGMCVCYKPADESAFFYMPTQGTTNVALPWYGGMAFIMTGLFENSTFQMTYAVNYEGIPRTSSLSIVSPTPSLRDGFDMDHTLNAVADKPDVESGPEATAKAHKVGKTGISHNVEAPTRRPFGETLLHDIGSVAKTVLPKLAMAPGS